MKRLFWLRRAGRQCRLDMPVAAPNQIRGMRLGRLRLRLAINHEDWARLVGVGDPNPRKVAGAVERAKNSAPSGIENDWIRAHASPNRSDGGRDGTAQAGSTCKRGNSEKRSQPF